MLTIICIIIIIVLAVNLNKKDNEIIQLKRENKQLHENIFRMATQLNNQLDKKKKKEIKEEKVEVLEESKIEKQVVIDKKKQPDKMNRNTLILITGSVFIVLAAILFLTSTWNIIPDIAKSFVLILFIFIFLGISYYAEEKLKIKHTAKAFFYIGMVYIPISLISIAYLGLLGNKVSTEPGIYLYLTASSILTSFIYIYFSKKSNKLTYASYLFQIFAVICFSCFLSNKGEVALLLVTIYNIAILIKNIYSKKKESEHIEKLLTISLTTITTIWITALLFQPMTTPILLIICAILLCGITLFRSKENEISHGLNTLLWIILVASIINITTLSQLTKEIIILLTTIAVYIKNEWDKEKANTMDWIVIVITMIALFFSTIITNHIWTSLAITLTAILINLYRYIKVKWNIHIALMIWLIALFYFMIVNQFSLGLVEFILLLVITEIIKYFIMKKLQDKDLKTTIEINSNIILLPTLCYFAMNNILEGTTKMVLIPIIIAITSYLNYKQEQKPYHLLVTYLATAMTLETIVNIVPIEIEHYFSCILVSLILIIIKTLQKSPWKEKEIFQVFYTISLVSILVEQTTINFVLAIITILMTLFYNKKYDNDKIINNLSYVFLTIFLYIEKIVLWNITLNPIFRLTIIILWMVNSYLSKERKITDWLALAYILLDYGFYPINSYYTIALLIIWSIANIDKEKRNNSIVKVVLYFSSLWLYSNMISLLKLDNITVITLLGYFTVFYLITRTIIKEDSRNIIEVIGTIVLCLIAVTMYQNELDGILFVTFLVIMMIISYIKKIEGIFYTSLFFIVFNMFLLTKEFWFSLPWWLYLLVVGFVLILFATNNELQDTVKKKKFLMTWRNHFNRKDK